LRGGTLLIFIDFCDTSVGRTYVTQAYTTWNCLLKGGPVYKRTVINVATAICIDSVEDFMRRHVLQAQLGVGRSKPMVGSCSNNVVKLVDLHNSQAQSSINFVIILGQHNHQLPMIIPRKGDKARCACQKLGGDKQRKK